MILFLSTDSPVVLEDWIIALIIAVSVICVMLLIILILFIVSI